MQQIQTSGGRLAVHTHGGGPVKLVFVHGNLACAHWNDLALPHLSKEIQLISIEWKGCGDSERVESPAPTYPDYSMPAHARAITEVMDALDLSGVGMITHSTGGIIAMHLMDQRPELVSRILHLDPVTHLGLPFGQAHHDLFAAMKMDRAVCRAGLASAAPTLFTQASLAPGETPVFADTTTKAQKDLFELLVDKTMTISDGIWFGSAWHLNDERERQPLASKLGQFGVHTQVLMGEHDYWIPLEDAEAMVTALPDATLKRCAGVGHSMNIEQPAQFAAEVNGFFLP
jgi:pimeloyl-ACP methyl ester carboxylesterase